MAVATLSNKCIPTNIRLLTHQIIDSSLDLIVDNYRDRLTLLIQISIDLSLEVCKMQRDDNNYEFPLSFFYAIADAYDNEVDGILELFMFFVTTLIQSDDSLASRQVSLFILMSIVEGTQEAMSERIQDILQIVLQIGDVDDPFVFTAACRTLHELIEFLSAPLSFYVDEITSFFVKHIKYNDSIQALDNLFSKSSHAPKNIQEIYEGLVSLIPSSRIEQIEAILSCLSSLLTHIESADSILQSFLPILNQIQNTHPELRNVIVEFFGNIVSVAPNTIKKELPTLMELIFRLISINDIQLNISVAVCLKEIARILPASLIPFLPQIVPTLIHMMNISINSSGLSETTTGSSSFLSSSVDFSKARCAGMSCLITFVGYMPNHMQEFATNPIFEFLAQRRGGVQLYTIEACDSISDACEGFKTLGIPIFEVLSFVMPKLSSCERKEMAISILTMAAEIVSVFGCKIREDILRILVSTINQILAVPPIGLLKTQHSTFIDQQVQTPLFYLISNIIDTISPKSLDLISSFFPSIIPYLNSSSPLMRGYAILTAAHICKCCNYSSSTVPSLKNSLNMNLFISLGNSSEDEGHSENGINAFHLISEAAFDLVSRCQNVDARRLAAKAFVYLIQADKSQFLDKFDVLVPFSTEMIEYCGYTGLWCAIAMQYDMLLDNTAAVEAVINELPNGTDEVSFDAEFAVFLKNINTTKSFNNNFNSGIDESAEIEMNQDFNASLEEKLPEVAVSLFSASERIYNETRHEVKIMLATIISGIDQESLEIYAGSNEGKIVKIQRRVQMLRMQSCM